MEQVGGLELFQHLMPVSLQERDPEGRIDVADFEAQAVDGVKADGREGADFLLRPQGVLAPRVPELLLDLLAIIAPNDRPQPLSQELFHAIYLTDLANCRVIELL